MRVIFNRCEVLARYILLLATVVTLLPVSTYAQSQPPKRAYFVMSQEKGHVCGAPQAEGILAALAAEGWTVGRNLTVKFHYMDQFRTNVTPDLLKKDGQKVLQDIEKFKPDIVFAIDDASIQFVMMQLIGRKDLPIVFSGMNGQVDFYNAQKKFMDSRERPGSNVTGIYEKLYAAQSLKVMTEAVPGLRGRKVVMITDMTGTGNALTKQFEIELKDIADVQWEVKRVRSWEEYTGLIETLNNDAQVKAIYPVAMTLTDTTGKRYPSPQIYDWTISHSKKPEMAINYFFVRMGLFGGAAVNFSTMGRLAGQKGAMILKGAKAGDLPIEDSPDYAIVFNLKRAKDLGIEIPARLLSAAHAVYRDDLMPLAGRDLVYDPATKAY